MTAARRLPGNALFHLVMIKPSHCDDDGYPVQWIRSAIPSNTLARMNALAEDAQRRCVLGPDVDIRLHANELDTLDLHHPPAVVRRLPHRSGARRRLASAFPADAAALRKPWCVASVALECPMNSAP
jgi:hypothetical protein